MRKTIIGILVALVSALGGYQYSQNLGYSQMTEIKPVLSSISATTTSSALNVTGAEKVTLSFTTSNILPERSATSTFVVTGSVDGTNYVTVNKLVDNVADTNAESLTRVSSVILDTNTTKFYSLDLEHDNFKFIKVTDTITGTTTSVASVTALIDY